MRIGIIIPDRGDRPDFLENCIRMMNAQTLKPCIAALVNKPPVDDMPDITWRYRTGYDIMRNKNLDVVAFWENDDWYHPEYLKYMSDKWVEHGKPDLFSTDHTVYYHIKLKKYFTMHHSTRGMAMNTFIKPDMHFAWCPDYEPYTDLHLYRVFSKTFKVFKPEKYYSIGIKHGIGKCGGVNHLTKMHRYRFEDNGFLKKTLDPASFKFYWNYFK